MFPSTARLEKEKENAVTEAGVTHLFASVYTSQSRIKHGARSCARSSVSQVARRNLPATASILDNAANRTAGTPTATPPTSAAAPMTSFPIKPPSASHRTTSGRNGRSASNVLFVPLLDSVRSLKNTKSTRLRTSLAPSTSQRMP